MRNFFSDSKLRASSLGIPVLTLIFCLMSLNSFSVVTGLRSGSAFFAGKILDQTCTKKADDNCRQLCSSGPFTDEGICSEYDPGKPVCFCHHAPVQSSKYTCETVLLANETGKDNTRKKRATYKPSDCVEFGSFFDRIDIYICTSKDRGSTSCALVDNLNDNDGGQLIFGVSFTVIKVIFAAMSFVQNLLSDNFFQQFSNTLGSVTDTIDFLIGALSLDGDSGDS